jgi:hypothetical protein
MGSTPDMFKKELDNHLSVKRQQEILEVVELLEKFKPTKIAVEVERQKNGTINEKYKQYLAGKYELERSEVYQLGFRIAAALHHEEIFCIDWMGQGGTRSIGEVYEWAKVNQPELFASLFGWIQNSHLKEKEYKSILDMFRDCNEPTYLKQNHIMNLNMARIKSLDDYIGMDWLIWWYKRNLIMFSNLSDLATSIDDRILFIVGGGHVEILSNFLKESGLFEVENVQKYLY